MGSVERQTENIFLNGKQTQQTRDLRRQGRALDYFKKVLNDFPKKLINCYRCRYSDRNHTKLMSWWNKYADKIAKCTGWKVLKLEPNLCWDGSMTESVEAGDGTMDQF